MNPLKIIVTRGIDNFGRVLGGLFSLCVNCSKSLSGLIENLISVCARQDASVYARSTARHF